MDHHYLPQFYLRNWAGPDGLVLRYTHVATGRVHEKRVGPRGTAFEPDLYSAPPSVHWESYDPNLIETEVMFPIDNDAATVHAKIVSGIAVLSEAERKAWLYS